MRIIKGLGGFAMTQRVAEIYVSLAPAIFAGILNMIWVRLDWAAALVVPMDRGRILADGQRLLGDHKTWKGFLGMIFLGALTGVLWGALIRDTPLEAYGLLYRVCANRPVWNAVSGALLGLGYALAELPNSFLKRRLGISPGKNPKGLWKYFFIFLDQADSVAGCLLILRLIYAYDLIFFITGLLIGALTHLLLNILLFALKLRKNMF